MLGWKSPAEAFWMPKRLGGPKLHGENAARQDAMRSLSAMGVSFSRSHPGMEKQQNLLKGLHAEIIEVFFVGCSSQDLGSEEVKDFWGPATKNNSPDGHCYWEGVAH